MFHSDIYLSLICLITSTSLEETVTTQSGSHSKSVVENSVVLKCAATFQRWQREPSEGKIKSALWMSSLVASKKRGALMKIHLANNAPNHRLSSDFRGLKVTLHEYLVTPRCGGRLAAARLLGGSPYPSLPNKQGK